jgi:hypothetical protein
MVWSVTMVTVAIVYIRTMVQHLRKFGIQNLNVKLEIVRTQNQIVNARGRV